MKHRNRPPAVVVGLSITGLGTVRSLARSGIQVIGIDSNFDQPSAHTRHCRKVRCSDINSEQELLSTLVSLGKKQDTKPVLFLSTDMAVLITSENRELLGEFYHFNLPVKNDVKTLMDKALFARFAEKHCFEVPQTFIVSNIEDVYSIAEKIPYPCVIKPPFRDPVWDKANPNKVFKVSSLGELIDVYERNSFLTTTFVIQELIPGPDSEVYFCLLWYNSSSQPGASFVGRKAMQWVPEFGSTCIAERFNSNTVLSESIKLLDSVGYKGIGSVEFKRDSRDGIFKIVEPTVGRADLQSAIAYYSGLNIPLFEYCDCLSLKLPEVTNRKRKMIWINEENLFWLLGNQRDSYPPKEWLRLMTSRKCFALLDALDTKPFLAFLRLKISKALSSKNR